jgi:O-antigen ligase
MVSVTNYERAAWAKVAVNFIIERPQGYGLVWESFRHIAKEKWPESNLLQSHSGWLDLTMGIGIPGVLLILLAAGLSMRNLARYPEIIWSRPWIWVLSSIVLLMITTEVSQKVYLDAFIYCILFAAALSLGLQETSSKNSKIFR